MAWLNQALQYVLSIFHTFTIFDAIDIALVSFLFYKCVQLVRETRAEQLVRGILLFVLVYYFSSVLGLKTMSFIMRNIVQFGLLAILVVFQPELRNALEHLGRSRFGRAAFLGLDRSEENTQKIHYAIYALCEAAQTLQSNRFGALILLERETKLGDITKTGTVVNADISPDLIVNIFYPKSPLHDGAMVVRDGRIYAAGCFLPLTRNNELSRELGTRHRAALGISEISDVLVVVVSEETGIISICQHGVIKRNLSKDTLRAALEVGLLPVKKTEKRAGFPFFRK